MSCIAVRLLSLVKGYKGNKKRPSVKKDRLGYIAVSAERGQLSWSLKGLRPTPKLKALIAEDR